MYQVITSGPDGVKVEAVYATYAEADAHAQRLRNAGCYATVNQAE